MLELSDDNAEELGTQVDMSDEIDLTDLQSAMFDFSSFFKFMWGDPNRQAQI